MTMAARAHARGGAIGALLLLATFGVGCLQMPVASLDEARPVEGLAEDEKHVWKKSRETQIALDASGLRFDDPKLEAYLDEVASSLVNDRLYVAGLEPRVRVLSNPDMNAFAFANGVVYVHTALLARMENEAQLAAMLSREYAHVIHRHALMKHRSDRATKSAVATTQVFAGTVQGGGYAQMFFAASSFSSMGGYHHTLELRADGTALELMDEAGYDLNEAPRLFRMTVEYLAEVHAQRPPGPLPFAFSTPTHMKNRIAAFDRLLATEYAETAANLDRTRNTERFRSKVHQATVHQAGLELDRGRFDSALRTAELALETRPNDVEAWVIVGEAKLRSKQSADRPGAIAAWQRAIGIDRDHAGANRALGLLYYRDFQKRGEHRGEAETHLARYLRTRPDAPDAAHVRRYLGALEAGATGGGR
jgi:Zn-dependent protease with chaperone function